MFLTKLRIAVAIVLVGTAAAVGVGRVISRAAAAQEPPGQGTSHREPRIINHNGDGAEGPIGDGAKVDMKKLEGAWATVSATFNGKPLEKEKYVDHVFINDKLTMRATGEKEWKYSYKLDPSQKPKHIDFVSEKVNPDLNPGKGIYELDGDTLKLCVGSPDSRPTEMSDKLGVLTVLKRKKQ